MSNKDKFKESLDSIYKGLCDVSDWMYHNPELGFEEYETSKYLVNFIENHSQKVNYPSHNLETAFDITYGDTGPLTVICVEYDALPEIGHACGHNIIATASIGAGLALSKLAEDLGIRVKLLGTPAEEGGGGKIILLNNGAFEDASCSMMIHPGYEDVVDPTFTTIQQYTVEYFGKDAHAAGAPDQGINALDAQIQLFVNASTYRQQMKSDNRMHGVIREGGFKPNIIPSYTKSEWYLRSLNKEGLDQNKTMYELFMNNATEIGRKMILQKDATRPGLGSTDMGNISQAFPSIHPMLSIDEKIAVNHQPEYAAATLTEGGHKAIYDGAYAMGATIIDLAEKNLWDKL